MTQFIITGFAIAFAMMAILWTIGMRIRNAAIVDFGWGMGYVLMAVLFVLTADGYHTRIFLLAGMVIIWAGRLALHLLRDRIIKGKPEDKRYETIRKNWGGNIEFKFFLFFQLQAVCIVAFSIPFYIAATNPASSLSGLEIAATGIWFIAVLGESVADFQLKKFKDSPANSGRVCETGLWHYSRHPNYFFEWLIWVGFSMFCSASPFGWCAFIPMLIMLYILTNVTGIPLAEEQSLRSRGDAYRRYQRTTSKFFPLPPSPV